MTTFVDSYRFAAAGGGFDPIADVGWTHAYWAEGTEFVALGYADTDAITSWPDEVGTENLAQSVASITYRAASAINSQPALLSGLSSARLTKTFASAITQPLTVVVIAEFDPAEGSFATLFDGPPGGSAITIYDNNNSTMSMEAGAMVGGGAQDANPHIFVAYFNGASSTLVRDGTTQISGNAGTNSLQGLSLFVNKDGSNDTDISGPIAFVGLFSGDVTGDAGWADFESWAGTHYGLTIA